MNVVLGLYIIHLQGCSSPIVVKFADSEKDKLLKRVNTMAAINGLNTAYFQQVNI